ncbi:MAG: prepilin-type N-terminal cleavage/methylation domain-containing protein [Candidatus Wallbacteria bacterium]
MMRYWSETTGKIKKIRVPVRLHRHFNRGFSLTEMVITVLIIGIMTIFAMEYYSGSINDAKVTKTRAILEQIKKACLRYAIDNGNYPREVSHLVPKYLAVMPKLPWNVPINIKLGQVNEVTCEFPWGMSTRAMSVKLDNLSFMPDRRADLNAVSGAAFAFAKLTVAPSADNPLIYNASLEIQIKAPVTAKNVEGGADFRFSVDNAEITAVEGGSAIELTSQSSSYKNCFEYTANSAADKITIGLAQITRNTNFTFTLFRPVEEGVKFYYGEKEMLRLGANPTTPAVFTRLLSESTSRY